MRIDLIALFFFIAFSKLLNAGEPKGSSCGKLSVVFETRFNETYVKVYSDDSLYLDRRITNKNIGVIEVADVLVISKKVKYLTIQVKKRKRKILLDDETCFVYVKRKRLFNRLIIEQSPNQKKFR